MQNIYVPVIKTETESKEEKQVCRVKIALTEVKAPDTRGSKSPIFMSRGDCCDRVVNRGL